MLCVRKYLSSVCPPAQCTTKQTMQYKLRTDAGRAVYSRSKAIVEPVFVALGKARKGGTDDEKANFKVLSGWYKVI